MNQITMAILSRLVEFVFAVAGLLFTGVVLPWLVKTGLPWLKEKRLLGLVQTFVAAVEKQAESGALAKSGKKAAVLGLLQSKGVTITSEVEAFIEAAVKELDVAAGKVGDAVKGV